MKDCLNVPARESSDELSVNGGNAVRLVWLRDMLAYKSVGLSNKQLDFVVRGYLLFLLGCTLFSVKSGTTVNVTYLNLLNNIDEIQSYGWGAAALARLYRQLGIASRANAKQICGYLTLLEAWAYEHFPFLRPSPDPTYDDKTPRANRWIHTRNIPGLQKNSLDVIRELLDMATVDKVDFDPYHSVRDSRPLQEYAFFKGCLCINCIFEPYMPDRVLRQLGHVQTIPKRTIHPRSIVRRSRNVTGYRVDYSGSVEQLEQWVDSVLSVATRGNRVFRPWDMTPEYLEWFESVSHRIVQNPQNRKLAQTGPPSDGPYIMSYLEPYMDQSITLLDAHRVISSIYHYCKNSTPLPNAASSRRIAKQRHDPRA
ncbi:hypothetical protein QJS10_CPA09g00802 [Acorus calamus]|uniref:Aminotransferase-like plant mobile domain-containing protein n=1 Tax=Acorus calamus TaxID=4465 RepID=A0AAV9E340_ACOCL|nr:hypothetical protein QJS10_CPA09g00802 [Acorus calamus]